MAIEGWCSTVEEASFVLAATEGGVGHREGCFWQPCPAHTFLNTENR